MLGQLGYGFGYRVLDAQYFGVAQARRRVFLVGHIGGWQRSAAVLFERNSFEGNAQDKVQKLSGSHISSAFDIGMSESTRREIQSRFAIRNLTPREYERAQGFPDDYTNIPGASDSPRYKALGNSMAVPVMRWIGERIEMIESMEKEQA